MQREQTPPCRCAHTSSTPALGREFWKNFKPSLAAAPGPRPPQPKTKFRIFAANAINRLHNANLGKGL